MSDEIKCQVMVDPMWESGSGHVTCGRDAQEREAELERMAAEALAASAAAEAQHSSEEQRLREESARLEAASAQVPVRCIQACTCALQRRLCMRKKDQMRCGTNPAALLQSGW
jgi:hypothetical protein